MGIEFRLFVWIRQKISRHLTSSTPGVRRPTKELVVPLGILLVVGLAGCGWVDRRDGGAGEVRLQVVATSGLTPGSGERVMAVLQKDGLELQTTLTPTADESGWAGSLANVPTGRWQLTVTVTDSSGQSRYVGVAEVEVDAGQTSQVQVRLQPAPAQIHIELDLDGFAARERVRMVAVRINPSVGTTMKILPDESGRWRATLTVPARTYDVCLELYEGENLTDPLVYATPWRQVEAAAASEITLTWKPESGAVSIGGRLDEQPDVPQGLAAGLIAEGVQLTWLPADGAAPVQEYIIYRRRDRFGRYEEIARTGPEPPSFIYVPSSGDKGRTVWFAVTAWDGYNESPRSEGVAVMIPRKSEQN